MRPLFDAGWRQRALRGDPAAVRALVDFMLRPLYGFCLYRVGRNRHLCEEVVQETLTRCLRDLGHYDPARSGDDIFPWLSGLARNEISRALGREKRYLSLDALGKGTDGELPALYARLDAEPFDDDLLRREETRHLVNVTMAQLPVHYRELLEAKYIRGTSVRVLAVLRGSTEKAVESQLTRARKAFRATFLSLSRTPGALTPATAAARKQP